MKVPSFLSPYVDGDSPTRLLQGLAAGAIGTMILGFGWGGWNVSSTVKDKVESAELKAMVGALAPICAAKFELAAKADNDLVINLNAVDSWQRDTHLTKMGWTTFPGETKPDHRVAEACAKLLNAALKLK